MPDSSENESLFISKGRGKWSRPGVPHRGWTCVDIEDLGAPEKTCEMCESQVIRYVHSMQHPEYPETLAAGCVCAGHMEENVAAARDREDRVKSRAGKRKRWLSRDWNTSSKGNDWIASDGFRVTVYRKSGHWGATVAAEDNSLVKHSRRQYPSKEAAKLAAFDLISFLLKRPAEKTSR